MTTKCASPLLTILLMIVPSLLTAEYKTKNLILVTADGLRRQEVFGGIDASLMNREDAGMKGADKVRDSLWAESAEERRRLLMPFLWTELVPRGVIFGNDRRNAGVTLRNQHRFSYPGYSEILTGRPQDDVIDSNALRPNPSRTVLEILREQWEQPKSKVALFGSWEIFTGIGAHDPANITSNAGYQRIDIEDASPRMQELSRFQFEILTPWRTVRHDYITFEMAAEYFRTARPRVLYIALGETDDWAHDRRYDRVLETARYFDDCLRRIWEAVQSDPDYRDQTTLLVATDHGRGHNHANWHQHGPKVADARQVWITAIGPDTPARGEAENAPKITQSDIAPTMLELAGLDYQLLENVEGKPIDWIVGR